MQSLYEGLAWRWQLLRRCLFLLLSFRNGVSLAIAYLRKRPCSCAVCWDGTVFTHPGDRAGLAETLVEIWHEQNYTGLFYRPAPGDVIIDAGANVGLFGVWLSRRYPACRILAFEPFEENYHLLRQNIKAARVRGVQPLLAGLGGESGSGHMIDGGGRSLDHRFVAGATAVDASPAVRVCSFRDALGLAEADEVALFKIDIEGSEHDLFAQASDDDLGRVRRFAVEYHDNIRPGTLDLLRSRLHRTHTIEVCPSAGGYGMLYAKRRGDSGQSHHGQRSS